MRNISFQKKFLNKSATICLESQTEWEDHRPMDYMKRTRGSLKMRPFKSLKRQAKIFKTPKIQIKNTTIKKLFLGQQS